MVFQCRPLFEHRFIGISLHSSITERFLSFFQIHDSLLSDLVVPWYLVHSPLWFLFTLCLVACHNICTNVCIETVLPANCEPGFRLFTNCKRRSILLVSFNKCWTQFQIRVKCVKFFPECMAVFFHTQLPDHMKVDACFLPKNVRLCADSSKTIYGTVAVFGRSMLLSW